jgi:Tfp pilus assembly protein PilE
MERNQVVLLVAIVVSAVLLFIYTPRFDDNSVARNHANAVGALRQLNNLEKEYSNAHSGAGFACDLDKLHAPVTRGYRVSFAGCDSSAANTTAHYWLIAVPTELGKTGTVAYCSSEEGVIWYDSDGSGSSCLANRKPLQ